MSEHNDHSRDESLDESKDLAAFEERLASFRPRAPRLRMSINAPVHSVGTTNASVLWRFPGISALAARCGWVVGVWTCGAIVGALAMYLVVRDRSNHSTVDEREADHSIITVAESPNRSNSQSNSARGHMATNAQAIDRQVAAIRSVDDSNVIDLFDSQNFLWEERSWVAGGLLPSARRLITTRPVQRGDSVVSSAGPSPAMNDHTLGSTDQNWELEYDSTSTISRDRLLDELLDHNPAKVL